MHQLKWGYPISPPNLEKKYLPCRIWRAIVRLPGYSGKITDSLPRLDVRAVRVGTRRSHPAMSRHSLTVAIILLAAAGQISAAELITRPDQRPDASADAASGRDSTDAA